METTPPVDLRPLLVFLFSTGRELRAAQQRGQAAIDRIRSCPATVALMGAVVEWEYLAPHLPFAQEQILDMLAGLNRDESGHGFDAAAYAARCEPRLLSAARLLVDVVDCLDGLDAALPPAA